MAELASALGVSVVNNRVSFPEHIGSGYFDLLELPNGLQVMISNYRLNTALCFERPSFKEEVYALRFETIRSPKKITIKIDGDSFTEDSPERSVVYLTCSLFEMGYLASAGTYANTVSIQLTADWMAKYLHMETYDSILSEYLSLKTGALLSEPQVAAYTIILDELKTLNLEHPAAKTIASNRVMELIELFFTRLYEKRNQLHQQVKISATDIAGLRKVETYIKDNYTKPLPPIDELSRIAAMSATKLKNLFKKVYGKPLYQYFQFYRMSKAKALLISGTHSVKDAASTVGYANFSNFTTAFRKVFGILPGDLLG